MACSDIQEVAYENFELVICFQVRHVLINPKHILCDLYWMELDTETLKQENKTINDVLKNEMKVEFQVWRSRLSYKNLKIQRLSNNKNLAKISQLTLSKVGIQLS